jgi:hypothetical protein
MARANAMWTVMVESCPGPPEATFTVKHEMMSWLRSQEGLWPFITVYRSVDGRPWTGVDRTRSIWTELGVP